MLIVRSRKPVFIFISIVITIGIWLAEGFTNPVKELNGKVLSVIDGDTYDVITNRHNKYRVRMEGIDAPEKGMRFYKESGNYLSSLCLGKQVRVRWSKSDRSKRLIAFTYLSDGRELSHEMIKAGWAWHFTKYNKDADLAALQRAASLRRLGLWVDAKPVAPWDYRKSRKPSRR